MIGDGQGEMFPTPLPKHCTGAYARHTDPTTSHDAAEAMRPKVTEKEQRVLDALERHGPCNGHEIRDYTGMPLNTVTPRFKPLLSKGLITYALGEDGDPLRRKGQMVWRIT